MCECSARDRIDLYNLPKSQQRPFEFCTDYWLIDDAVDQRRLLQTGNDTCFIRTMDGEQGCGFFGTGACMQAQSASDAFVVEGLWEFICALPQSFSEWRCLPSG